MEEQVSKKKVTQEVYRLLSNKEGVLALLSGALMISDFDDPDIAVEEAVKTFNSNRVYFERLIERSKKIEL